MSQRARPEIIPRCLLPGESASSWLIRIARANAFSLHELVTRLIGQGVHHDSLADLDIALTERLRQGVLQRGLATPAQLAGTLMEAQLRAISDRDSPQRQLRWVLGSLANHRRVSAVGLQYCPACLREDETPYFRTRWRFSWAVVCQVHGTALRDTCPECGEAPSYLKSTRPYDWEALPLSCCMTCQADFRRALDRPASNDIVGWQREVESALDSGWMHLDAGTVILPLYLQGIAVLLRMLRATEAGRRLRRYLDPYPALVSTRVFDELCHGDRLGLLTVVARLLVDWPSSFCTAARRVELRWSALGDQGFSVPFWLEVEGRRFDRSWYKPDPVEQKHAAALLDRYAGIRARTIVREWLGESPRVS